jgi:hypothetical protein
VLQVCHGRSCQFIQRGLLAQDQAILDAKDIYERLEAAIGASFEEEEGRHIALTVLSPGHLIAQLLREYSITRR